MGNRKLQTNELVKLLTDIYEMRVRRDHDEITVFLVDGGDETVHEGAGPTFEAALADCAGAFAKHEDAEAARLLGEASSSRALIVQLRGLGIEPEA